VPLVEQELPTLSEHLSSPPVFSGVRITRSLVLYVCFVDCCLSFCPFSLCCLFFFDIRILIAPLVSSNSSCTQSTASTTVPGDQRPGIYYSGINTLLFITVVSEVGTIPLFFQNLTLILVDVSSRQFSIYFSGEKRIVFFLPAKIYGALLHLIAC
jgi:hypothetical protein